MKKRMKSREELAKQDSWTREEWATWQGWGPKYWWTLEKKPCGAPKVIGARSNARITRKAHDAWEADCQTLNAKKEADTGSDHARNAGIISAAGPNHISKQRRKSDDDGDGVSPKAEG